MTTCTFLSDDLIVDADIYDHLRLTILELVHDRDAIDFLFPIYSRGFPFLAFCAILEARRVYPDKHIRISVMARPNPSERACSLPLCCVDRMVCPPPFRDDRNQLIARWMIDRADLVICYHYADLDPDNSLYEYARQSHARLIDLAQPETLRFLRSCISRLPADQLWLLTQREQGVSLRALGEHFGRTGTAMSLRLSRIRRNLKFEALHHMPGRLDPLAQPVNCAVLLGPEPLSPDELTCFEQAVVLLVDRSRERTTFFVERACPSEAMFLLAKRVKAKSPYRATIQTGRAPMTAMLGRSDFVICTAAHQRALLARRRKYISPHLKFLNISRPLPQAGNMGK